MEEPFRIDVSQFVAECKSQHAVSSRKKNLLYFLKRVIDVADKAVPGSPIITEITCRKYVDGYPCAGQLTVMKTEVPRHISWECGKCRDKGILVNWHTFAMNGVSSDIVSANTNSSGITKLVLSEKEFAALSSLSGLDLDSHFLVRSAVKTKSGVEIYGTESDMVAMRTGLSRCIKQGDSALYSAIQEKLKSAIADCSFS